ncbi:MAG TPA: hypothetical protein DHV15_01995 [Treponema sp.]|uniref:Uncharacterized protein n=1 Tax=Treponema denticola (strain ATCC 35405 / DSM 14222 / CIP 103919 / JCM 8153 / KCTC 15104) TaxID=243275 RepID=Q73JZ2_TREDE|nr:hypothetical protein TDE_2547 [Treponema denticola ATCC 35405]HCY94273.1 hypothetical protein [Treponema sp.]
MLQHDILLEKKLNFFSKTTRQNKKNVYTTPPPEFFAINRISAVPLTYFQKSVFKRANRKTILKNNSRQEAGGFKQ